MIFNDSNHFLEEHGHFSSRMPGFEYRPQQVEMAEAIQRSLVKGQHLIVEAGTGTGKSLAYLIPAILWAVENNKKVAISTYTKTLQQQILNHDIPLLQEELGIPFRYALCLGHENYLSLRRLKRAGQAGLFTAPEEDGQMQAVFDWVGNTSTGLKNDLPFQVLPSVWEEVGRQKDQCLGKNCETYDSCFYFKARKKWFGAHLLIVNHHLFFANVASSGAVLPAFDAVVFDEAQNVEDAATSFLGLEISNSNLYYFLDRLYNPKTKRGVLTRLEHELVPAIRRQVILVRQAVDGFFTRMLEEFGKTERVLRLYKPLVVDNTIYVPLKELHEQLQTLEGRLQSGEDQLDASAAATRCFEFNNTLSAFLNQHFPDYVYWLEVAQRKRFCKIVLRGVPVNIAGPLKEQVFDKIDRMVLTSATLTTEGEFDFIKERIGLEPKEELVLDSPFDYASQALLYVPADMPDPTAKVEVYVERVADRCRELIRATGGKTFILFTSYAVLNRVYEKLEDLGRFYPLLKQGDLPTGHMIERFKEIPSVIFGTSSFWQGVDIPGEALTSVIITKLPFDVPKEPLTEARLEDLKKRSIDPFRHYQIPRAIIQLKQGFGRLIRKQTDTGIVSILDSRVRNRGYGKKFLASLPPARVVDDLDEVSRFLSQRPEVETAIKKLQTG
ncbi:MAG: helicase [Nitrospinaceae bacterium]|nr:MAG: helicase [Nitrospinaceae bacterium]